ncbi:MAG: cyclic nucleotide-binding domain-containing protein [Gemmatimonadetes bacterium]|nr:cyclic nucleotide-binding domain-containing protein [Gemmatimonadota bacterium]
MAIRSRESLFQVRPGELSRVVALFGHLLVVIAALIVLKSVGSALFLKRLEPDNLPYLYIGSALTVSAVISLSTRFIDRVPRRLLIVGTTLFFVLSLVAFRQIVHRPHGDLVYPILYLWVEVYATVMATQFWTFAGDLFTGRQGRRLFGLIGAGGVIGSILGGIIVSFLAEPLGGENLLLVAGGLLLPIPALVFFATRGGAAPARPTRRDRNERYVRASLAYFREHRYPWLLASMVFVTVVATTFIDYQFKILAAEASRSAAGLTKFFGQYNLIGGILSLVCQLFVTSFVLNRLGVFAAVMLMPTVLIAASAVLLLSPGLAAVFVIKLLDSALSHSVDLSGKQLLYVPLPERLSGTLLSFIDGLVGRVGLGFAGMLLIPLVFLLSTAQLGAVTFGFLVVWALLAFRTRREYREALQTSLREGGFRPVFDAQAQLDRTTTTELVRALESGDESQVLVALDFIEQTDLDFSPYLRRLLLMRSPEIHVRALRHAADRRERADLDIILGMLGTLPPEVTPVAVEAIAQLAPDQAAALIRPFLNHRDPRIRGAAIRAVLSDGRWDANDLEAMRRFEEMLAGACEDPEQCRLEAARSLADRHLASYRWYLLHFLRDGSPEVQRAAIASAGRAGERHYLPILLSKTLSRHTREPAVDALAAYGDEAIPFLDDVFESAVGWKRLRKNVIRALSEIGSARAADVLLDKIRLASSSERYDLIKALNKIRDRRPDVVFDDSLVGDALFREAEDYYRNAHYLVQLGAPERTHLLITSLSERLIFTTERVSRLLALLYPPAIMSSIYRGVHGRNVRRASNAHELLDTLIDQPDRKRLVLPLFDDLPPQDTIAAAEGQFTFVSRSVPAVLEEIVGHSAPWLRICALYFAGDQGVTELRPLLEWTAREDADEEARRSAQLALVMLENGLRTHVGGSAMETLVEKVLFLKEVEIFAGLMAEDLTELAGYLRPVSFAEGETIFEESESGDALYIIRSGRVDLHYNGRRTESRGPQASLGELSAVDQGPRTFTAIAGTTVEAFEIGELELAEILNENAEISRTMLRVLAGRVRRYLQLELAALQGEVTHAEPAL